MGSFDNSKAVTDTIFGILQGTVGGSRCRERLRKSWKDIVKEWTGHSISSLAHCCSSQTILVDEQPSQWRFCRSIPNDAWASREVVRCNHIEQCQFRLKPSEASFLALFANVDNFRPEVHSDAISGGIVDPTGVNVPVKFRDSRSNRSRYIRLPHFAMNDNDNNDVGRRTL